MTISTQSLFETILGIRHAEMWISKEYFKDHMKTPMHMSCGEEAIVAGVLAGIGHDVQVLGTYRSHAVYLAKTKDYIQFFSELIGTSHSMLKGRGGSMHLTHPDRGLLGTSAIVGAPIPLAVGAAYANKIQKKSTRVVVFFGDGATEEGVFWESLNLACVCRIPVIFVCEDNGMAVQTPKALRQGFASLLSVISGFRCQGLDITSPDAVDIAYRVRHILSVVTDRPVVLYARYIRQLEHVGVNSDLEADYRSKQDRHEVEAVDPVRVIDARFRDEVGNAVADAIAKTVYDHIDSCYHDAMAVTL